MQEHIQYDFLQDGHFAELKEAELLNDRIQTLDSIQSYIGTFFSKEYVLKNVLRLNDAEIDQMRDQIKKETEIDPMDGGIEIPDDSTGIRRDDPPGGEFEQLPPEGVPPVGGPPPEQKPGPEEEPPPEDQEVDSEFIVKKRKKS